MCTDSTMHGGAVVLSQELVTMFDSGNVHIKNGEVDQAVECYTKAIDLDPTNATYFCNRYSYFTANWDALHTSLTVLQVL